MPSLMVPLRLSFAQAETEYAQFKRWFDSKPLFGEAEVVRELKKHDHLCLLMGFLGGTRRPDLFKHEFIITGVFRADYVVANSAMREFTFVEFEGGLDHSIFGPGGTNQMRSWGDQIQHGYGQIADWSWAKNQNQNNLIFQNAVGFQAITETYALICGRDSTLDFVERARLSWRNNSTSIAGQRVLFLTFDDLMAHFDGMLDLYRDARSDVQSG